MKNKILQTSWKIFLELIPIFIMFIFIRLFLMNNLILTSLMIITIIISLFVKYEKKEYILMIAGAVLMTLIEILFVNTGAEKFTNPLFFGIPVWLPIIWAYGLVVMKRIVLLLNSL